MSTENSVEGAKFVNAKPVHFPQLQRRWSSDFGGRAAYRSAAFTDRDGSVGGVPGATIVIDNGIASAEDSCTIKASWNAAVCKGDMGRLSIGDTRLFPEFVAPSKDPIVLERNGKRFEYNGETTLPSGAQIKVVTGRNDLALHLREMDKGSWVLFELPGFAAPEGAAQADSLEALRATDKTSWFKDGETLWAKLVVEDATADGPVVVQVGQLKAQASLDVSRTGLGG
jgi:cell migration-inducing and hyaluronan-binding protein